MDWLFLIVSGQIAIFLLRLFAHSNEIKNKFLTKMFECPFCVGTWCYFCLCCFFKMELTSYAVGYYPIVSEMLSAMILAYTITLFMLGVKFKFGTFEEI